MKDAAALSPEERAWGYDNPGRGDYRLALLKDLLRGVVPEPGRTGAAVSALH